MKCVNSVYWNNPENRERQSRILKRAMKNKALRKRVGKAVSAAMKGNPKICGKNSHHWKGNKVGYHALHTWLLKVKGKATKCVNALCTKRSKCFQNANLTGKYRRHVEDFIELCKSCHTRFDRGSEIEVEGKKLRRQK